MEPNKDGFRVENAQELIAQASRLIELRAKKDIVHKSLLHILRYGPTNLLRRSTHS